MNAHILGRWIKDWPAGAAQRFNPGPGRTPSRDPGSRASTTATEKWNYLPPGPGFDFPFPHVSCPPPVIRFAYCLVRKLLLFPFPVHFRLSLSTPPPPNSVWLSVYVLTLIDSNRSHNSQFLEKYSVARQLSIIISIIPLLISIISISATSRWWCFSGTRPQ